MLVRHPMTVRVSTAICGLLITQPVLMAQEHPTPRHVHSRTQDGITVQVESVAIERVFNEAAWLRQYAGEDWKQELTEADLQHLLPAKTLTIFVSVRGSARTYGPVIIASPGINPGGRFSGLKVTSPPKWQTRRPRLPVDPDATGLEWYSTIDAETQVDDLFPADLEVFVETESGEKLRFEFADVEF